MRLTIHEHILYELIEAADAVVIEMRKQGVGDEWHKVHRLIDAIEASKKDATD